MCDKPNLDFELELGILPVLDPNRSVGTPTRIPSGVLLAGRIIVD